MNVNGPTAFPIHPLSCSRFWFKNSLHFLSFIHCFLSSIHLLLKLLFPSSQHTHFTLFISISILNHGCCTSSPVQSLCQASRSSVTLSSTPPTLLTFIFKITPTPFHFLSTPWQSSLIPWNCPFLWAPYLIWPRSYMRSSCWCNPFLLSWLGMSTKSPLIQLYCIEHRTGDYNTHFIKELKKPLCHGLRKLSQSDPCETPGGQIQT